MFCKSAKRFLKIITLRRNEEKLVVRLLQTKVQQLVGDLLPVESVQEDVPLVQGPEGRVHIVPESGNQTHLNCWFLRNY